jgi:Holliday junction resolvase RusA-like endonuclease
MFDLLTIHINPCPKPRMTRCDMWKQRPAVMRYRAFADELRLKLRRDFDFNGTSIEFGVPMPKSWSKKKKAEMNGKPHTQTPDLDNYLKALLDAHTSDDSGIHTLGRLHKCWGYHGYIWIRQN